MAFRRKLYEDNEAPAPYQPPAPAAPRPPAGATTPPAPAPPAPTRGAPPQGGGPAPLNPLQNGVNLEQQFAAQRGNEAWRDPAYSGAQWGAWEEEERKRAESGQSAQTQVNKYNPTGGGCPPDKPFSSRPGPNGQVECAAKPDDCPDGSHVVGTPGRCVPNEDSGGAGGGGVGGGAPAGGGAGLGAGFDDMNQWWMNQIKSGGTRYTPEAMAALEADQFARTRRQEKLELDAANRDMAERGVRGSAVLNTVKRDIASKASGQIGANRAQIMRAKIDADYQDKQAQIKNAESWVNSMRDFLLRSDANAIQREQIAAQIRLASQNIAAQKDMLEQQYRNNLSTTLLTGGL